MLQFINGFSCAMNTEKDELIIKFLQQYPSFEEENNTILEEEVSTLVMGKVTAQKLLEALAEVLEDEE